MTVIINSGRLKHPITFQRLEREDDDAGSAVETWRDFANDRVRVQPIGAAERIRSDKLEMVETHVVIGRYRDDINSSMRIIYGNRVLEITGIINADEENVQNNYLCREINGDR